MSERRVGNVVEWIATAKGARVLLLTISRNVDIRRRQDEEERDFVTVATRVFTEKGATVEVLSADDLQSMWDNTYYDLVILDGVLERQREQAMEETKVLKLLRRHLTPKGRLYAIEKNRLGLQYFAGRPRLQGQGLKDDGTAFEKAGYTRKEIQRLFTESGFSQVNIYYPFDNEREVQSVYTEAWPPDGRAEYIPYREEPYLRLCDERALYRTLLEEDCILTFSNVIMAEAFGEIVTDAPRLVYAKYTDNRREAFAIRTGIYRYPSGKYAVTKVPLTKQAAAHVAKMHAHFLQLEQYYKGYSLQVAACAKMTEGVGFAFLEGEKLSDRIDAALKEDREEAAIGLIQRFVDVTAAPEKLSVLDKKQKVIRYAANEHFMEMFGTLSAKEEDILAGEEYLKYTDVGMDFDSMIISGQTWTVYDYEWVVDFAVPFSYVLYAALYHHFCEEKNRKPDEGKVRELCARFGIGEEKAAIYRRMRRRFLRYIGEMKREDPAADGGYTLEELAGFLPDKGRDRSFPVRIDVADGKQDLRLLPSRRLKDGHKQYEVMRVVFGEETEAVRILLQSGGILRDVDIRGDDGTSLARSLRTNADKVIGGNYYFFTPQAYMELTPRRGIKAADVRFEWLALSEESLEPLRRLPEEENTKRRGLFR